MAVPGNPSISYTKDGRWLLAMSMGRRDLKNLAPFLAGHGVHTESEQPDNDAEHVHAIGGSTASATSATEIVQRLTRRFRYDRLPWMEAQSAGLIWAPIRKPHENATDEHWLARHTYADVEHPEHGRAFRYPVSKWLSTSTSWSAGRRAPLLGEDDDVVRSAIPQGPPNTALLHQPPFAGGLGQSAAGEPFPLQGVRILDFTWFLASAGSTRFLAALGADVLKVEWKTHPDTGRGSINPEGGREAHDCATDRCHR